MDSDYSQATTVEENESAFYYTPGAVNALVAFAHQWLIQTGVVSGDPSITDD